MIDIDRFISQLDQAGSTRQGRNWTCPAHQDRRASLSIDEGRDGRVLLTCHAGCTFEEIVAAVPGVEAGDLGPESRSSGRGRRELTSYQYVDETGTPLFDVVRFEPKDFRQRKPDGSWGIAGVRRVL